MLRRLTLVIPDAVATQLAELARREYRAPKDQAAVLLIEAVGRSANRSPDGPADRDRVTVREAR